MTETAPPAFRNPKSSVVVFVAALVGRQPCAPPAAVRWAAPCSHKCRTPKRTAIFALLAILLVSSLAAGPDDRAELLKARESVWRSWFANDTKALEALVPPDTIVISSDEEK